MAAMPDAPKAPKDADEELLASIGIVRGKR
jgi:hypothetical protein